MRNLNINKQSKTNSGGKKTIKDERGQAYVRRDNARAYIAPRVLPGQSTRKENYTDEEYAADRRAARAKANKNPLNSWNPKEFLNPKNITRENVATVAQGLESQFRVSDKPNFFDDYVNPANMLGQMASSLGTAPLQAKNSNSNMPYVTAIATPLVTGALGGVGAKNTSQFVNNVANPLAGIVGTPEQAKKVANTIKNQIKKKPEVIYNLTPSEIQLLDSVRNIGSISRKSGNLINDLSALQGIRKSIDHLTDQQFKDLIGYPKAGLDERIAVLKKRAEEAPTTNTTNTTNSNTTEPRRSSSASDGDIDERVNATRRRVTDRVADRIAELNETNNQLGDFNWNSVVENRRVAPRNVETTEPVENQLNDFDWSRFTEPVENTVNNSPTKLANSKAALRNNFNRASTELANSKETLRNNFSRNQASRPTSTYRSISGVDLPNFTFEDYATARNLSDVERKRVATIARMRGIDLDNLGNHYTAFEPLEEILNSKSLLERLNTTLENKFSKDLPYTRYNPETEELLPILYQNQYTDVNRELMKAVNQVRNAKKGETFIPSYSLSSDSFKASVRLLNKVLDDDIIDISYHGKDAMNPSGFSQVAGLPLDLSFREMNFNIQKLNERLTSKGLKKLPLGEAIKNSNNEITGIRYPSFSVTRKKLGGYLNNTNNNNDMVNYVNNKKIPKAIFGALVPLVTAAVGVANSAHQAGVAKEQKLRQERLAMKQRQSEAMMQSETAAQGFEEQGYASSSFYMDKGGKLSQSSYDTLGGELKPLSSNTELVKGNTHESNAIDGVNGVKLMAGGEPIAEVENEEVIKDGQKVYSDTLKPDGSSKTYAELVKILTKKKGKEEERVQGLVHRVKDNTAKRNIEKLNIEEDRLFAQQEQDKLRKGIEPQTTDSQIEKGMFGLDLEALDSAVSAAKAEGAGYEYGGGAFGQYVAPFVDNVANLLINKNKPQTPTPMFARTPSLNTEVNVNAQLGNVRNAVERSSDFVRQNTSDSNVSRSNVIGTRLQGSQQANEILERKDNAERGIKNQASIVQSNVQQANANTYNNYQNERLERQLDKQKELSFNIANLVDDYGKGVQYRDSIELDKEKNAMYERIYSGDNKDLAARTKTINPSQIREWQNNPEEFQAYYKEIMSDPTTEESTKRKLNEVYRKLLMKPSYANYKI